MRTHGIFCLFWCLLFAAQQSPAQHVRDRKGEPGLRKTTSPLSILDRAGGVHNKSNIGSYFVNQGKLYAQDYSQGPTFEWPIGSTHEFVYRANPYVGIPGNVIQGRFRTHTKWEAAAGYNNRDSAQIAFSDKPFTWPATGWPVKDASGNLVFVSNQDSYCVYNDSVNDKGILNIQVNQTGYAFSPQSVRDMVIYIFDVINRSTRTYDSLYFGIYADISCGGSDYVEDYGHRKMVFDKSLNRVYLYKTTGVSYEWNGYPSGYFGYMLLQTPKVNGVQLGATDWHYNRYDDDLDQDSVLYGILSSSPMLYADQLGPHYFHLGQNAPNPHYDDPGTISPDGDDIISTMGSGPYTINPGDTLRFITAWVGAGTVADMDSITAHAYSLLGNGFVIAQPPAPPKVSAVAGDGRVYITWDNRSESSRDLFTGAVNFEGYNLYKSTDQGLHWDQIDRNAVSASPQFVPIATYDKVDGIGKDVGLRHSYVDSSVTNGFQYWYSVTAYSVPNAKGQVSESAFGRSTDINVGIAIPRSTATGRSPVEVSAVQHVSGSGNVLFNITPLDIAQAGGQAYTVSFAPVASVSFGSLRSVIQVSVDSNQARTAETFRLAFQSSTQFSVQNLTEGTPEIASGTYSSGTPILFEGIRLIMTDTSAFTADRPAQGDTIIVSVGVQVDAGTMPSVLPLQALAYGATYATSNGIVFSVRLADTLAQSRITYKDRFTFTTTAPALSPATTNDDLSRIKVVPNPYLVSSLYEQEYGILRKEPLRQLKFNNLPAKCTIYIFSLAGDKIQTIYHYSDNGTETWDMRTLGNREIAPGVYIYLVKTDTAERIGRFAVIK